MVLITLDEGMSQVPRQDGGWPCEIKSTIQKCHAIKNLKIV